jgi:hypothetical protein
MLKLKKPKIIAIITNSFDIKLHLALFKIEQWPILFFCKIKIRKVWLGKPVHYIKLSQRWPHFINKHKNILGK